MSIKEICLGGGGLVLLLMTLIQIAPIKFDPWSAVAKAIGRALNSEVLTQLSVLRENLDTHIRVDDERNADLFRTRILQFNNELLRDILHTREDFIEILAVIDEYERYSRDHEDYKNNRAKFAIENIQRVYKDRLQKHDFL